MLGDALDCLSIWEIAHRWHGHDPNRTDPAALPLEVQDTLRLITRLMWQHDLPSYSAAGVERNTHATLPNFSDWLEQHGIDPRQVNDDTIGPLVTEGEPHASDDLYHPGGGKPLERCNIHELRERYNDHADAWVRQHDAAIDDFEEVFRHRRYDRARLESVYLSRSAVATLCQSQGLRPPAFWFSPAEQDALAAASEQQRATLRPSQLDQRLCQAIARTLWHLEPSLTITAIIAHPALRRFGNGAQYTDKTLRGWISKVDERPEEKKRGRPRKNKSPALE